MSERVAGFSLIELLIALALFAVIAVMTQQALLFAFSAETGLNDRRAGFLALQRAVARMVQDIANAAPRPIRNANGDMVPLLRLAEDGRLLEFTRGGLPNPAQLRRSNFQRVLYAHVEEDGALERRVWRMLDPAPEAKPAVEAMLEGVEALAFRVYADDAWREEWPDPARPQTQNRLPRGVEVVITTERWGRIRRVVSLK